MVRFTSIAIALAAALVAMSPGSAQAQPGTAFTYQGVLASGGANPTGAADFRFRLYDALAGGNQVGSQVDLPNTAVSLGKFTVSLDFGSAFVTGQARWLEIDARSPAGAGSFTTLSPRQAVSAAPLAQGIAGVAITPAGPTGVDQDQTQDDAGGVHTFESSQSWQSFTAGSTGTLEKVQVNMTTPASLLMFVYEGVGPTGQPIGFSATPGHLGVLDVAFSNVTLIAGRQYTLAFISYGAMQTVTQQIPGAVGSGWVSGAQTPVNWWFRTFMTPLARFDAVSAIASSVLWSGVKDVPPNVSGAFSPWSGIGGGIAYPDGAVGIGTSSPEGGLSVTSFKANLAPQEPGVHMGRECCGYSGSTAIEVVADGGGSPVIDFNTLPSTDDFGARLRYEKASGTLYLDGANWCATAFCPSSGRLKDNVRPIDGALDLVGQLQGVRFDWKPEEAAKHSGRAGPHDVGFIAEDVDKVLPELVVKAPDGTVLGMDYARLTSVAVEAIKQLRDQNDAKQREIDALKIRLDAVEAAVRNHGGGTTR